MRQTVPKYMFMKPITAEVVSSAYQKLYDFVALRNHPLTNCIINKSDIPPKELGWHMHSLLLDIIEQLDPGPRAPINSKEWRRHKLMMLRYVDGLVPEAVAQELNISRRHFYREHSAVMDTLVTILTKQKSATDHDTSDVNPQDASHLLQVEMNRLNQYSQSTSVSAVTSGVIELLEELILKNNHQLVNKISDDLPIVKVNANVLRQLLLSIVGAVSTQYKGVQMTWQAVADENHVNMIITLTLRLSEIKDFIDNQTLPYADALHTNQIMLTFTEVSGHCTQIHLPLPLIASKSIMVIDDNQDVLKLYEHYLTSNNYRVLVASSVSQALALLEEMTPSLIVVDLMMPEIDGWELLRQLRQEVNSGSNAIPVVICSVLRQRELAIAMGAQWFLEKPITEEHLLHAIESLLVS